MVAMKDTSDILDNPDNNAHINCIRAKADDEVEEKAREVMFDAYDAQRGKRVPRLLTAYFPNLMDRWEALVALMRHSKAAVAHLFAIPYMDRYVHNPVTGLDTKLSNNYTNKMRDFNKDVKAASKFRGSVTTVDRITSIYDAAGSLVSTFVPPEKRLLSDFLGHRLGGIAKPKRVRTKTTTGDATTPTSSNSSNLEQHVGGTASSPMTPIQEEDEDLMAAIQEGGKGVMPSTPGKEEAAMGEADKDDGDKALEGPNEPSTPHPDAVDSHFHSRYLTPVQDLALGKQSYNYHEDSTPDKHQPLGGQSEQPSPNGHRAPSNNEMDVDLSPFFAEAYHEPIDSYDGEDVSSQAALDGEVTKNGNYPYEVDDDWYER